MDINVGNVLIDANIERLKEKRSRFAVIVNDLENITLINEELEFMSVDINREEPDHPFGLFWGGEIPFETKSVKFALNGQGPYKELTKNIIAITKKELQKIVNELETELENDFGGFE